MSGSFLRVVRRNAVTRAVLGTAVLLACALGLSAEDKKEPIDAKKLVGKWEPKEKKEDVKIVLEFTKDSKLLVTITEKGKDTKLEGTYKLDGNKITTKVLVGENERVRIRTINKITDTEFVSTDEKGKEDTLLRIKEK